MKMHYKQKNKRHSGFTLIELILFMGLFSVLMVVLMRIFTTIIEQQAEVESYSAVESDRLFISRRLDYDIARATAITVPASPGNQGSSLSLTIASQTYTYALQNGNLMLTSPTGTDRINQVGTTIPTV
nr:type II secretion system protein [Candidatus Woesebacteria bacterium]